MRFKVKNNSNYTDIHNSQHTDAGTCDALHFITHTITFLDLNNYFIFFFLLHNTQHTYNISVFNSFSDGIFLWREERESEIEFEVKFCSLEYNTYHFFYIWSEMEWFQVIIIFILKFWNWCYSWSDVLCAKHIKNCIASMEEKFRDFIIINSIIMRVFSIARIFLLLLSVNVQPKLNEAGGGFAWWKCVNTSFTYTLTHFPDPLPSLFLLNCYTLARTDKNRESERVRKKKHIQFSISFHSGSSAHEHTNFAYLMNVWMRVCAHTLIHTRWFPNL